MKNLYLILCTVFLYLLINDVVSKQHANRKSPSPKKTHFAVPYPHSEDTEEILKSTDFSVNGVSLLKTTNPELNGSGVYIAQKEHRSEPTDLDILGSFLPSNLESPLTTLHATRVASVMVGKGITSPQSEGVAPKSKIYSVAFDNLSPEKDDFYNQKKISVVNNSFGTEIEPFYGQNAIDYDATSVRNPNLLFVFSSGNVGTSKSRTGKYANLSGVGNITGNYKMAKNILTVGAINQYKELASVSSRGPAYDGRIKPEVVAFSNNGTSEAAAMASGIVALAQQAYQKKYGQIPSSSLTRAILINSAEDVGAKGIDHQTGFGSLNVYQAVKDIQQKNFWENTVIESEGKEISINIPDNVENLKITLTWTDPPALFNAPVALVNNLDLLVTLLNSTINTWQPWVLNTYPHADSLKKSPIRKRDALNSVEQISIEKPKAGVYKVNVYGFRIPTGQQKFSVSYHYDLAEQLSWIYPAQNTKINANQPNVIRWKSTLKEPTGQLSYSVNQGKTWQNIASDINLTTGFYEWNTPDVLSEALVRISTATQQIISKPFVISPTLQANSLYFCADSTQIYWDKPNNANGSIKYNLYQLDKTLNTWIKRKTVDGLSTTFKGTQINDSFAVEPLLASGIAGLRSDLISSKSSGVSCFYDDFSSTIDDTKAYLFINLTTSLGVKSLVFQKIMPDGVKDLSTVTIKTNTLGYFIFDTKLDEGVNNYQVKIVFTNGKIIYTRLSQVFYSETEQFWLYPTPLYSNEFLNINSTASEEYTLKIFNITGTLLIEQKIYNGSNQIALNSLLFGNYFYIISSNQTSRLKKGKISIL